MYFLHDPFVGINLSPRFIYFSTVLNIVGFCFREAVMVEFCCLRFAVFLLTYFFLMQLHGDMCKALSAIYCKVLSIFPSLESARPRSKSGIQALCSLHLSLEKSKNVLQHCSTCSKLYLVRFYFLRTHTPEDICIHNCICFMCDYWYAGF